MYKIRYFEKISTRDISNVYRRKKVLKKKVKCLNTLDRVLRVSKTNPTSGNINFLAFNSKFRVFMLRNVNPHYLEFTIPDNFFLKKNVVCGDITKVRRNDKSLLNKLSSVLSPQRDNLNRFFSYDVIFLYLKFKNAYVWFPFYWPKESLLKNDNFSFFFFKNISVYWINYAFIQIYRRWLKKIVKCIYNFTFIKMRYKGKHYRWYRKKKGVVIRFGHSHLIIQEKKNFVFLKKKGKIKLLFFGTNLHLLRSYLKKLTMWKPTNVYTARGIRFCRQRNLRKAGKVSIYR